MCRKTKKETSRLINALYLAFALARSLVSSNTDHVRKNSVWRHLELTAPKNAIAKVSMLTPFPTLQFRIPRAKDDHQLGGVPNHVSEKNQNLINALIILHISHVRRRALMLIACRSIAQHVATDRTPLPLELAASRNTMAKVSLSSLPLVQSAARLCFS